MYIYKIVNDINDKVYVGQTINSLVKRFNDHCNYSRDNNSLIANSIKKYGKEHFKIELIETVENQDELNDREIYWIKELNTISPFGLNLKLGGNCAGKFSDELKQKHSRIMKEIAENPNFIKKMELGTRNKLPKNDSYSKYKGVSWHKIDKRYVAAIKIKEIDINGNKNTNLFG